MLIFSVGEATDICVEDPCDGYTIQKTDEEHEWTIVPDDVLWIDLMAIGNNIESAGWTLKEEMGALAKFPSRRKPSKKKSTLPIRTLTPCPSPSQQSLQNHQTSHSSAWWICNFSLDGWADSLVFFATFWRLADFFDGFPAIPETATNH